MNDFESTVVTALQDEADRATLDLDTVAASQRCEAGFERIDRDRQGHMRRTVLTSAAAAVLVVAIALIADQTSRTTPKPTGPPSPEVPGGEVPAPDPFSEFGGFHVIRLVDTRPPRLSHCTTNPRTWGAIKLQAAAYRGLQPVDDHHLPRLNEYLLQYSDRSSAHRAFLNAFRQLKRCPNPTDPGGVDPLNIDRPRGWSSPDYNEGFAQQRERPRVGRYVLRVARAGNVLVVVDDTEITSDRSQATLSVAVDQAIPLFKKDPTYFPPASARTDLPGWNVQ